MRIIEKYIFTIIIFLFFVSESFAQSSPYTRLGIGDVNYAYSARKLGMGQMGAADAEANFISFYNPAALFNLKRTRIEFNFNYNGSFLSGNNLSTYYGNAEFAGFMFAFPISNKYGIGAISGLVPFSSVSYNVSNSVQSTDGNYETSYQGKGGLSKLFLGASYKLPLDLVLGATFDYYFGNIDYTSSINFIDQTNADAKYNNEYRPKGIGTTLGLISPALDSLLGLSDISNFRIGLTYNFISKLRTDTVLTSNTTLGTDTVSNGIVNMKVPGRLTAGLSFVLNNKYLLSFDYAFQAWKNYSFNGISPQNLRNSSVVGLGFEYKPETKLGASFWEQIIWRAGLSYEQTQYLINDEGINQYSVSGGFSLPISQANTLDLGLRYAMRGTSDPGLFKENTIKLYLTFSLGDIWFIREEK
jgi:hypothetical protein